MPETTDAGIETSQPSQGADLEALAHRLGAESRDATTAQPNGQPAGASGPDLSDLPETFREAVKGMEPEAAARLAQAFREADKPRLADYTRKTQEAAAVRKKAAEQIQQAEIAARILGSNNPKAIRLLTEAGLIASGLETDDGAKGENDEGPDFFAVDDPKQFRALMRQEIRREAERLLAERDTEAARARSELEATVRDEAVEFRESMGDVLSEEEWGVAWKHAVDTNGAAAFKPGKVAGLFAKSVRHVMSSRKPAKPENGTAGRAATVSGGAEFQAPRDLSPWERQKRKPTGGEIVVDELRKIGLTAEGLRDLMLPGGARRGPPKM